MKRRVTAEVLMLLGMLGVSSYMLIESFSFSYEAGIFPRFAAVVTVCGCVLLLVREHLPQPIQQMVTESAGMFDQYDEEFQESASERESGENEPSYSRGDTEIDTTKQVILVGLLAGYGLVGYAIGLVWATPVFIFAFAKLFGLPRLVTLLLVAVGIAAALTFNSILPVNMTDGVIV